jgi:PKD repeat protein
VRLAGLNHASVDGQAGYQDFSCSQRATLTADRSYTLQLTTSPNAHDVRVYVDLNDDGQFSAPTEVLYQGLGVQSPTIPLSIASTQSLVYNRPLRLRIVAAAAGSPANGPCGPVQSGQAEDYSVTLLPNAAPPAAAFTLRYQQLCGPVRIALSNATTGGATSYAWDFGDGSVSTQPSPPAHTYANPGVYEVRLVVQNAFGRDTARQRVAVATTCPVSYCPARAQGGSTSSPAYFTRFRFADLDNTDPRGPGMGYLDYRARYATVQAGQTYPLLATSLPWQFSSNGPWAAVDVFIDYNQDGQFDDGERTGPLTQFSPHQLNVRIPASAKAGATRLRAIIHLPSHYIYPGGCSPSFLLGSIEEYTVVILPPAVAPRTGFFADLPLACTGAVQFRDTSWTAPTRWQWSFGDGGTSTQQHPRHQYAAPGTYTVALQASNAHGTQVVTRPGYVTVTSLAAGPQPAACLPSPVFGSTQAQHGFDTLAIGSRFLYRQPWNSPGYRDETCSRVPIPLVAGASERLRFADTNPAGTACFAWLDANDDGAFDPATELVFNSLLATQLPRSVVGELSIPATALTNRPLRLRVSAWGLDDRVPLTAPPSPCSRAVALGQVRDFTVVVSANLLATRSPATQAALPWQVAPNPSRGRVTVFGPFSKPIALELCDALGRVVYREKVKPSDRSNLEVDLHALRPGVYWMRLDHARHMSRLVLE